ncbi:hypothetical protein [Streptomyces sp. cg35]
MTAPARPAIEPQPAVEAAELVEPRRRDFDETPQEAARRDRLYWNRDED